MIFVWTSYFKKFQSFFKDFGQNPSGLVAGHMVTVYNNLYTTVTGMSSEDIAEEIRTSFPGTEEVIVQYLGGYLVDDAGEEEDVLQVAHDILKSVAGDRDDILEKLMLKLGDALEDQLNSRLKNRSRPKLQKLDRVMDMSKSHLSNTIALSEGVDLESINKGK
jgi:ATP-binding cassette, subfamily F, member 3